MRRPHRAGLGVLSPRGAPNLGKIRQRACPRLIPFPGTGDVLLAPSMISHPLAYVARHPRHRSYKIPWHYSQHKSLILSGIQKVITYLACPPVASSLGQALPRPAPDSALVRRPQQHEKVWPATTPAYSHQDIFS